jgi:hypothetical protein
MVKTLDDIVAKRLGCRRVPAADVADQSGNGNHLRAFIADRPMTEAERDAMRRYLTQSMK